MPRLRVFSGGEICRLLQKHGFEIVRKRGSHIYLQQREGSATRTVTVPDHRAIKTGTLLSIIRQSGLPRSLFES